MRKFWFGLAFLGLAVMAAWALRPGLSPPLPRELARLRAATPPGMVLVPAGEFWMGSDDPKADEEVRPMRRVRVASFYIDLHEVTNAQVKAVRPEHAFPPGRENDPATGLTREEAETVLTTLGKRLPTFAEWEKAARGTDGRTFPWGNEWDATRANVGGYTGQDEETCQTLGLKPVDSYPSGASPYGCLNMIGNAWEWVSDDHPGPPVRHIIRGGAFGYPDRHNRTYAFSLEEVGVT
ncbi:MAG: SUMF1/EgtB/PvdO family nonheme iron enzyme [Candidatus Eremiobacterota bacterium]